MKSEILYKYFIISSLISTEQNNTLHNVVIFAIGATSYIVLYKYVATCFDQLRGHPQENCAHKTKIIIANSIWATMRFQVLLLHDACR